MIWESSVEIYPPQPRTHEKIDTMNNTEGRIEWFGGDPHGLAMYRLLVDLAHTWDDLVDKDKPVSESDINTAFLICLVHLPINPFYARIQHAVMPMWLTVVSAYEAANQFERDKDPHGLEIAHVLRYAAGQIIAYGMLVALGAEDARKYVPEMWKAVVAERFEPYRQERMQ